MNDTCEMDSVYLGREITDRVELAEDDSESFLAYVEGQVLAREHCGRKS